MVAGEGGRKNHCLMIGEYRQEGSVRNVLSRADAFNLNEDQALTIVSDMLEIIKDWKQVFFDEGISGSVIRSIDWAILHKDVFIDS